MRVFELIEEIDKQVELIDYQYLKNDDYQELVIVLVKQKQLNVIDVLVLVVVLVMIVLVVLVVLVVIVMIVQVEEKK
jgi:cytoskeletal protein RodZ